MKGRSTTKKKQAEGSGDTLQDAIDDAIAKALKSGKIIDSMINWKLLGVAGTHGGIASLKIFKAKIEFKG